MEATLHTRKKLRTDSFSPHNANCVCLHSEGQVITLFDLPHSKAFALAKLFADEETRVYEAPGKPSRPFSEVYSAEWAEAQAAEDHIQKGEA